MATCPVHGQVKKIGSFYLSEIGRPLRDGHDDFHVQYSCECEYVAQQDPNDPSKPIGWVFPPDDEYVRVI